MKLVETDNQPKKSCPYCNYPLVHEHQRENHNCRGMILEENRILKQQVAELEALVIHVSNQLLALKAQQPGTTAQEKADLLFGSPGDGEYRVS